MLAYLLAGVGRETATEEESAYNADRDLMAR
jgi:hypothetical protein